MIYKKKSFRINNPSGAALRTTFGVEINQIGMDIAIGIAIGTELQKQKEL